MYTLGNPKFTFSREVLNFTNTANFHVKDLNFHGKSHNFYGKILIFADFILIFTECNKNQEFSQKCPLLSH